MRSLKTLILRAADCNSTILITGESGTGKELIARSIHEFGQRQQEPFLAINCGALTESLLESEMFGYVKGA
jgi:sigma-54 dependent transcriptional regulator, acetoin dehydrogenase operon transcriptional activator AcoR